MFPRKPSAINCTSSAGLSTGFASLPLANQPIAAGKSGNFCHHQNRCPQRRSLRRQGDYVVSDNSRLSLSFNHGVPYRTIPRYFIDDRSTYYNELDCAA